MRKGFSIHILAIGVAFTLAVRLAAVSPEPADSLLNLLNETPSDTGKARIYLELSKIYFLNDFKRSLDYAQTAIELAEKEDLDVVLKEAVRQAGRTCFHAGLMERASRYFNQHLRLIEKNGSKLDLGGAYINLGAVRLFLMDFEAAKTYNIKALSILEEYAKDSGNAQLPPNVLSIYNNLGIILREQKKFDEAEKYLVRGIETARRSKDSSPILTKLLNNQAILFMLIGNIEAAARNLEESLGLSITLKDKPSESATRLNLGKLYREKQDYDQALFYAKASFLLSQEVKSIDLGYNASAEISSIYEEIGPADSTVKYLTRSQDLLSQINVAKAREDMARQELEKYYRQKEIEEKQQEKKSKLFWGALITLLIAVVAGVSLFYLRTKKALDKTIGEKNNQDQKIEILASEREQLNAELESKERQLAVEALHRFKNKEMLEDVTGKLLHHVKSSKEEGEDLIKKILRDLQRTQDRTASLRQFEVSFLNVQKDFFEKLTKINPNLSPNERRLCAFLRQDMSSKDISSLTGQSVNSINVARIRLRKKLNLTNTSVSLTDFLANL